ncbi:Protein of unknown function [Streptococcus henryi]|jgi:hypothetical protein|uniref:DUF3270 family protein n=1 Tax=Streptococcus henryi TaxID=439219 RepID=A0A1G6C1A6_9STRE|nr:DUF3270 family protein [Streptococcus henryi]SDB26663.1 Protein of unknown function [Streptococcus henryi]
MPELLKQEQQLKEDQLFENASPKYQEFHEIDTNSAKLRELVFFARIACFGTLTVFIAFMLLVANFSSIGAFSLAILLSLIITTVVSSIISSLKR